jgi:tight adherence protein B
MLANALKSTPSLGEAIASTALLVPRPFSEEVDLLVKELHLGISLNRALGAMALRIGSTIVSGAIMMIVVARQTGGNLPTTLENAAAVLRESARLEGVLRTKTAEGRGQVLVLSLVPFVLCLIITWLDPAWFGPMLDHPFGRVIMAGCFVAWMTATAWAHHIAGADL